MAMWLRKSTASQEIQLGMFVDDTDFKTAETGLTIANTDIKLFKHGATSQASKNSGGATHIANGWYYAVLDATDTNTLGLLEVTVNVSGALSVRREFMILPAMIYDSLVLGTDRLDTNTTHINDVAASSVTTIAAVLGTTSAPTITSGRVNADITHIATAAVSTSTAQLGVNVVNFGGSAGTFASGRPAVNASYIGGVPVTATTSITFPSTCTVATTTGAVGSVTGAVGSVTGSVGSIASGGITSGSFAAGAINNAAMSIDGSELTAIPWNAAWDAEVQSEVEDALVVHRLDELLNADSDIDGAAPPTVGSVFHELMTKTTGSFTYDQTTDSLEALRDRGDAAWTTATGFSTHSAADVWSVGTRVLTAGTNIQLPSNGLANVTAWAVDITGSLSGSVGSVSGAVGSVTGNVGGNVTGSVGSLATQAKADVNAEVDAALADIHLDHLLATTYDPASKPGAADALLNELVESDAGVSRFTANALEQAPTGGSAPTAEEIADEVETRTIAAVTTLTNLPAITSNWLTAAGLASDAVTEIAAAVRDVTLTGAAAGGIGDGIVAAYISAAEGSGYVQNLMNKLIVTTGTAQAGAASTITLASGSSSTSNFYRNQIVYLHNGTGVGQSAVITAYNGTTKVATIAPSWNVTPDNTSNYVILSVAVANLDSGGYSLAKTDGGSSIATATDLATVDGIVDDIKAKTDNLTFGVANAVNANITYVNETAVGGTGETGDEWGPV